MNIPSKICIHRDFIKFTGCELKSQWIYLFMNFASQVFLSGSLFMNMSWRDFKIAYLYHIFYFPHFLKSTAHHLPPENDHNSKMSLVMPFEVKLYK